MASSGTPGPAASSKTTRGMRIGGADAFASRTVSAGMTDKIGGWFTGRVVTVRSAHVGGVPRIEMLYSTIPVAQRAGISVAYILVSPNIYSDITQLEGGPRAL